ncbi:hypothetical protein [Amycolatopsis azurea]|uniref:Uncharacterized protein n=1 Tax=Amycolatopsis azurea DSM 43854 TaxID=1238180 RepID=M2PSM3_9PSEU|nr:hypothetical protein [Amycolatopsis azurea]EMD27578.1 hypothetical protein C791_1874 [Amycolatopsis azurea DSM 43854]
MTVGDGRSLPANRNFSPYRTVHRADACMIVAASLSLSLMQVVRIRSSGGRVPAAAVAME